ncbi:hypothetical protein LOTGIDRAFT_127828 [Lottia gigantea]|uniref:G-protein coupled receptors family 1 profile domain-containing protein n=1 Tax=Lottia gigantea TaxID=225164 RepID=V3ZSX9_LOTGI|nr:hypothetical protein LOTGIDRAFT_127828 [Lottia gigantea]ESO87457.1 hypothetical protein LOTGIDRAFT_127828 [Lottia gigantea]
MPHLPGLGDLECVPGEPFPEITLPVDITKYVSAPSLPRDVEAWEMFLKVLFYLIAFVLDIVGNSIVILIIILNKKMRTTTNILILNLSVSDIMVGIFCMWVHVGNQISAEWIFGEVVCKVNNFIQVLALTSSVLTLTVISIERYIAIVHPFKPKWSPVITGSIIIADWVLAIAIATPHLFVRKQYQQVCSAKWPTYYIDKDCETSEPGKIIYYIIEGCIMYFLPIVIMIITYTIISVRLLVRKTPGVVITSTATTQQKAKRKVIKMLIAVLVVFIVCWTPQQVLLIWDVFREKNPADYVSLLKYVALYVAYFNSAINPILYGGLNENFRKGFSEAFRCILLKRRNKITPSTFLFISFPVSPGINNGMENDHYGFYS